MWLSAARAEAAVDGAFQEQSDDTDNYGPAPCPPAAIWSRSGISIPIPAAP